MSGGYNEPDYNALINAMKADKNLYSVNGDVATPTAEGAVLLAKLQDLRDGKDNAYQAVYNAFYDEFASNTHYHSSFQKLEDYDMDSFGLAIKKLFKNKLESGQSDEEILNAYNEAHNRWVAEKTEYEMAHQQWVTDKNAAQVEAQNQIDNSQSSLSGGGLTNLTPHAVYTMLYTYAKKPINEGKDNDTIWNEYQQAVSEGKTFSFSNSDGFFNFLEQIKWNWVDEPASSAVWSDIKNNWNLRNAYIWNQSIIPAYEASGGSTTGSAVPTLDFLMSQWLNQHPEPTLSREPQLDDFKKSANGDEYYAQYNGNPDTKQYQKEWTAAEISNSVNSKEHSYFYYTGVNTYLNQSFGQFTLNIDGPLYTDTDGIITNDTPFYLFLADRLNDQIQINLSVNLNRPLVICYMGSSAKFDLKLNGHKFRGIVYTPNSSGGDIMLHSYDQNDNTVKGIFEGTWMSDSLMVKDGQGYYKYVGYDLEDSLDAAMPGYTTEEEEHGNDGSDEEDDSDDNNNPIKVIKLVKKVEEIKTIEEIN